MTDALLAERTARERFVLAMRTIAGWSRTHGTAEHYLPNVCDAADAFADLACAHVFIGGTFNNEAHGLPIHAACVAALKKECGL